MCLYMCVPELMIWLIKSNNKIACIWNVLINENYEMINIVIPIDWKVDVKD